MTNSDKGIILFSPDQAELIESEKDSRWRLVQMTRGLIIKNVDDKEGYQKVHDAHQLYVKSRTSLKNSRLWFTRHLDQQKAYAISVENSINEIAEQEELRLKEMKTEYKKALEEKKEQEARKKREQVKGRFEALSLVGFMADLFDLEMMSETEYQELLDLKTIEFKERQEAERIKKEQEEADRIAKEEADRIEQEELRKQREEIAEAQRQNQIKQDELNRQQREHDQRVADEKAKKEAEEQAIAEKKKKEQEDKEKEIREQAEIEEDKKYQEFIRKNEWRYDTIGKSWDGKTVILWKKVDTFTYNID